MSLQDLITEKTPAEMLERELELAEAEGLATTSWQVGSVIRTILVILAHMFSMFSGIIVAPVRGGFGDLLTSLDWAIVWAKQNFNVDHVSADSARGSITATNASDQQHDLEAGELIVAHATTGKLYRNVEDISIPANGQLPNILIASDEVGTGANAAPGAITRIVGPELEGVTITNPGAVLGADDETVVALVDRSRAKLSALSAMGPKDAYNYIAKTPEFSATATPITRAKTKASAATGAITVYIATADGAPINDDVEIVQEAIDIWAEPWCHEATAVAVSEVTVNITYSAWVRSGFAEADIETAIANALAVYFASIDIGGDVIPPSTDGYVYTSALVVVISTAKTDNEDSIGVVRVTIDSPVADVEIEEDEVAVLGTVTGSINYLT